MKFAITTPKINSPQPVRNSRRVRASMTPANPMNTRSSRIENRITPPPSGRCRGGRRSAPARTGSPDLDAAIGGEPEPVAVLDPERLVELGDVADDAVAPELGGRVGVDRQ